MKKHAIATIILTLALASLCRPSALQAGESFHFKGQGANASFYHTDECISTSVYVFASDSVSKDQSGPPTSSSWGNVGIDQWNDCTYEPVRSGYGYAALADADLQVNSNLSAATLTATIP